MSLHIGNLSPRTRRDDLERVFRRFGRCTIQIKDKYGFVVYNYPASAEKALKTLRGMRICGEAITLSWSKQQPHALQRFHRGGKLYEPPRKRYYSVKENADRRLGPNNRRDYEMDSEKAADGEVRKKLGSSDLVDEQISYKRYGSNHYVGESGPTSPNDRKNHPGDDRWGEQVFDPANGKITENSIEFDRYEPHHPSDCKRELDESQYISPLARSRSISTSQERTRNTYNRISEKNSRGRMHPRKGYRDKKRNRRGYGSVDRRHLKGVKGPSSSSSHSDYTSSRPHSRSRSSRSLSRSRSRSKSKSMPSKKNSRSPPSCHSGTKSFNSRSTSRSRSPTCSFLPVEQLTRHASLSPDGRQKKSRDSVENVVSLGHSKGLFEEFETKADKLEQEEDMKDIVENNVEHFRSVSRGSHELLDSYIPQSNSGGHIVDNPRPQNEDFVGENISALEADIPRSPNASNSARMSSEEMYMVLKHYGLQYPEEEERGLPVEAYFGSARLWPWEMIYYRRLKKGPISTENYLRRIAQNEEFGIVDKYIRGSSGWEEMN